MTLHRMELTPNAINALFASHHFNTPTGPWFDLLRPHLTLVPARVPTKIFGNELRHFAHRSDVSTEHGLISPFLRSFLGHIGKSRNANCGGFAIYDCLSGYRSSGWTPCCIWAGSTWTSIPTCEFRVTTSVSFGPARIETRQANDRPSAPSVFDRLTNSWDTRSRLGWRLRRIAGDKSWIRRDYA
jgi:hypothetical protein